MWQHSLAATAANSPPAPKAVNETSKAPAGPQV
jgi:hypothetical protein